MASVPFCRGATALPVVRVAISRSPLTTPCRATNRALPAPVHPVPLLRVAQDQALQRGIVRPRVAADFLAGIGARLGRERLLEAQHVRSVGLAPARRRKHLRLRCEGDERETLERPGGMAEEIDLDAVPRRSVLVEREDDRVACREPIEYGFERASPGQQAEARLPRAPVHEAIEPARLDRPAHEMDAATHLRKLTQARDGGDFPVAEMPR